MKNLGELSLHIGRALSKSLIIFPFCLISPENFIYLAFIFLLFIVEFFLLFKSKRVKVLVIIFTSIFSYVIPFSMNIDFVFFAFLICDFICILSVYIRPLVVSVPVAGLILFSIFFQPFVYIQDFLSKKDKPYYEFEDKKIDLIKVDPMMEGTENITYSNWQLLAKIIYGDELFLLRVQSVDDREIVIISIISALSFFLISFYISRYIIDARRSNSGERRKEYQKKDEQDLQDYSYSDSSAYVEYLRDSLLRIRENLKNELEDINAYERDVSKFERLTEKVIERAQRNKSEILSTLKDYSMKIKLKEDYSNIVDKISEFIKLLGEIRSFSGNLLSDILTLKENFLRYERDINRRFREFENLFHEIFSPLGGIENQVNSLRLNFHDTYQDEIFKRCEQMISEMQGFLKNLSEIYESFHILHLNSQVRAHKIRDKVPSFEVIPHAIFMMLGKMRELMSNIETELKSFENFIQEIKRSRTQFSLSVNFQDISNNVVEMKSAVESIVSHVSSVRSALISNIKSYLSVLNDSESSINYFSRVVSDILYDIGNAFPAFSYALSQVRTENDNLVKNIVDWVKDYETKQK